jgi:tetratricopeptide (TPR) repeat protein
MLDEAGTMNSFRKTLTEALEQAKGGRVDSALENLDFAFRVAIHAGSEKWASLLGRNLAILCEHAGDRRRAAGYLEQVVTTFPADRRSLYQLDLFRHLGDVSKANASFRESLRLAVLEKDNDLLESLALEGYHL